MKEDPIKKAAKIATLRMRHEREERDELKRAFELDVSVLRHRAKRAFDDGAKSVRGPLVESTFKDAVESLARKHFEGDVLSEFHRFYGMMRIQDANGPRFMCPDLRSIPEEPIGMGVDSYSFTIPSLAVCIRVPRHY